MRPSDLVLTGALAGASLAAGCAQTPTAGPTPAAGVEAGAQAGTPWRFDSAPTPEGWPEATPVGEVLLREYPRTRVAVVEPDAPARDGMFMTLFRHIESREIEMTAPVEMVYDEPAGDGAPRMRSMAFLYRDTRTGEPGADGAVEVRDVEPQLYASTGVRGGYTDANFREGLQRVEAWLAGQDGAWEAVGPPRYLGYNGPFVLPFLRYGEVQVPVAPRGERLSGGGRSVRVPGPPDGRAAPADAGPGPGR